MAPIETMIEITSTSIATRSKMRDLVTATTTLIATTSLDKNRIKSRGHLDLMCETTLAFKLRVDGEGDTHISAFT